MGLVSITPATLGGDMAVNSFVPSGDSHQKAPNANFVLSFQCSFPVTKYSIPAC